MVALKLVFVSLLSALVATALPVPQVGPAPADTTDVATDGATEDWAGGFNQTWKKRQAPAADEDTTAEGATEDSYLPDWKRQVAPPADSTDAATDGATEDWAGGFNQTWKRDDDTPAPVAPAAAPAAEDDTTTGATEDWAAGWTQTWKRDDDTPAPVAPAPADDSTTSEGDFHIDSAGGGFGGFVWKKRDDAVAPVARV